jgi:hypothetical protein
MRCIALCALAIGFNATAAAAQDLSSLKYGTVLRVTEGNWTREGRLGWRTPDSLHMIGRFGESFAVPLQSVTRIERQRARSRVGGAAVGMLVGSIVVAPLVVMGCAIDMQSCRRDSVVNPHASYARGLGTAAVGGAAVGALLGGVIGAVHPGLTWSPVPVGPAITARLTPERRTAVTIALSLAW